MKTILFVIACFLLTAFSAAAQTPNSPQPALQIAEPEENENTRFTQIRSAGFKGGVNLATFNDVDFSRMFMGVHAGLFGSVQASRSVGYSAELNYSRLGLEYGSEPIGLNYASMPLLINIYSGPVILQAGVYGAYLFHADSNAFGINEDATDYFNSTDHGFLVGLSFMPSGAFLFGVRFNLGLKDINNNLPDMMTGTLQHITFGEMKTRNTQIYIGHTF